MGDDAKRIAEIAARVALKSHFGFLPPQTRSDLLYLLALARELKAEKDEQPTCRSCGCIIGPVEGARCPVCETTDPKSPWHGMLVIFR